MRPLCSVGIVCLGFLSSQAANPPNLPILAAKAAATVKRFIPGSDGEAQGATAVVKKRTYLAPNFESHGGIVLPGKPAKVETPDGYGVMFIIRLQRGPYTGQSLPKAPQFDPQHAQRVTSVLRSYLRTGAVQEFPKSNIVMVVDVLFGQYTDTHMLQQAYTELTRFMTSELQR